MAVRISHLDVAVAMCAISTHPCLSVHSALRARSHLDARVLCARVQLVVFGGTTVQHGQAHYPKDIYSFDLGRWSSSAPVAPSSSL
jgi:hypothetical protein